MSPMKDASADKKGAKIRIQPLGDRIAVKELSADEKSHKKTTSGIIIPDTVNDDKGAKEGTVVAVGPGKYIDGKLVALDVKIGDIVLFQWGDKIKRGDEEYYIVGESSVLAIIK